MPPVKKPKPQKTQQAVTPAKKSEPQKNVVSGQLKKKFIAHKTKPDQERGIVFIKHLPHGFFEQQLRQYFKQFGRVMRVRLGRSARTGGSKGYAFVEFEYPEVAKVAADTMDNYLMFQKVVKASYIPPEQQNFNYFKTSVKKVHNNAGKEIYISDVTKATQRSVKAQNNWTETACQKRTLSNLNKIKKLEQKYKHLGIDFKDLIVHPVQKSKAEEASTSSAAAAQSKPNKKQKKEPKLEDLLGNTINDDSDDEDYVDESESEEDQNSSEEEEEDLPSPPPKKQQKKVPGDVDRLLKRKPGSGGIQKKKTLPVPKVKGNKKASQALQLSAAKQLAQPLPKNKLKKQKK